MTEGIREKIQNNLALMKEIVTNPDYKGWIYWTLIDWIYCSHCGKEAPDNKPTKRCPNCDADMSIIGEKASHIKQVPVSLDEIEHLQQKYS